ncbi:hypothetical protein, partial [Kineococcus glutinatus]|uniref:hypothetical protein n=1 Tax=Kineococcus glutinatus TaxID=1070872 RepID=UPI0031E84091
MSMDTQTNQVHRQQRHAHRGGPLRRLRGASGALSLLLAAALPAATATTMLVLESRDDERTAARLLAGELGGRTADLLELTAAQWR